MPGPREIPRVSVIIPCFESAHFLADAVSSVLAQREPGVEVIVVDDGSSDAGSVTEALAPFGDAVMLIRQEHAGLPAARNRGIDAARGVFVAFVDADDLWKPGFLRRQLTLLEETNADLVYCDAELFGSLAPESSTLMEQYPSIGKATLGAVLGGRCVVVMSTVVTRADRVRRVGGFDERMAFCEDLELWVRMLADGCQFSYHRDALALRRIHEANMSNNGRGMVEAALEVLERHGLDAPLDPVDHAAVVRRIVNARVDLKLRVAKAAIARGDLSAARRALWALVRARPRWKLFAAAVGVTLVPGPSIRFLQGRS